ncbi:MAG: hypothetical protein JRE20_05450 [Deltaproteobacteria bacterium]|jgi:hypothetical protein|nr:hypothetical protein [Deltaproteobacteria bacterium]
MKVKEFLIRFFIFLMVLSFTFAFFNNVYADLSDGLVAYYPFNGNADDESGNGNNGNVNGAIMTTDSIKKGINNKNKGELKL